MRLHQTLETTTLNVSYISALQGKKSVYMITNVLMAKTIEFRVTRGTSSRIFHLGNASPLVFGLDEYLIGNDGKLIAKVNKYIRYYWYRFISYCENVVGCLEYTSFTNIGIEAPLFVLASSSFLI